jgi:hypothetical protein
VTPRDLVVAAEDGVGLFAVAVEELSDRLATPCFGPRTKQGLDDRHAGFGQHVAISLGALMHYREAGRTGDMGDAAAAKPAKMFHGQARSAGIVRHEGDGARIGLGEGVDRRNAEIGQIDRQMAVDPLAGGDDAVDALVQHRIDMELAEARVVLDVAEKHRDAVVDQRVRNARHDRQGKPAIGIVSQQADGEAAPPQQALRQTVRAKPETLRRLADALARLGSHPPLPVECFRSRRDAHAGIRGHLAQGDGLCKDRCRWPVGRHLSTLN